MYSWFEINECNQLNGKESKTNSSKKTKDDEQKNKKKIQKYKELYI